MDLGDLLHTVAEGLEGLKIPYLVTGSMAAIAYGEPRFTNNIDIAVRLDAQAATALERECCAEFELDARSLARAVERRSSFSLKDSGAGLTVDFMVTDDSPFNASRFRRARNLPIGGGRRVQFASPEDVILKKLEAFKAGGSEKHLRDIAGVLRVSEVDRNYIDVWAERLGVSQVWSQAREGIV